ncbi:MAG: YkgJ family cysteine cluster protein [Desulfosoma sp.]
MADRKGQEKGGDGMTAPMKRRASSPATLEDKCKELEVFYETFERATAPFIAQAVCGPGCADCCTNVGEIYAATLEGLRIMTYMEALPIFQAAALRQKIAENRAQKKHNVLLPCPFLDPDKRCAIYPVRPFSCRRLYSVEPCGAKGPVVHREFWALAEQFTRALQLLDPRGYSGHVSYILGLLEDPSFLEAYLVGRAYPTGLASVVQEFDLLAHAHLGV